MRNRSSSRKTDASWWRRSNGIARSCCWSKRLTASHVALHERDWFLIGMSDLDIFTSTQFGRCRVWELLKACKSMMMRRISSASRVRKAKSFGASEEWAETQSGGRGIRPHGLVRWIRDAFARRCTPFRSLQERRDWVSDGGVLVVQGAGNDEELRRQYQRQTGRKLRTIRSDNVYITMIMKNFVENEGINHQWSSAHVAQ